LEVLGASQLKNLNIGTLAPSIFYAATGIIFFILLPIASYPPHIGLTGVMSLITAYGLYTKRRWAKWLVGALFFVATTISLYTVYFTLLTNVLVSLGLIVYAVFTWYFTYYLIIKKI
jgi:SNF family Na+-dependent transporter